MIKAPQQGAWRVRCKLLGAPVPWGGPLSGNRRGHFDPLADAAQPCHDDGTMVKSRPTSIMHAETAGHRLLPPNICDPVLQYAVRRSFSTSAEMAMEGACGENMGRTTGADPSSITLSIEEDDDAEYAWPPLQARPTSFVRKKRSDFNDIIEKVARILSGRSWSLSVADELNKLNACIDSYQVVAILKLQSSPSVALGFFSWLKQKEGYKHNAFTYSKMFEILGNAKELQSIGLLMDDMLKDKIDLIPNVFNVVARAYASVGLFMDAVSAFERMEEHGCKPDSHAYDIIIDILVKAGCPKQAYSMYHKMHDKGFFPNLYVCNLLIDSYWRVDRADDALALFEQMKEKGVVPNMNTYNFLVKGLAKSGKAEDLCVVVGEMEEKGLKANLTTYNTLISALVQAEEINTAVDLFRHMLDSCIKPNNFTFSYLIRGLGKAGRMNEAQGLFKGLKELGVSPDEYVYNALVLNLSRSGKPNAAFEVLHEMRSAGLKPSMGTYLALVDGFKELDKPDLVRKVFHIMQADECTPHIVAYHDLIEKYYADKNIEKACQVFQDMKRLHLVDAGTYNLVLSMYGRLRDVKRCRQTFDEMRRAGIEPTVVTYSTMIQMLGKTGHVKDAFHLFKEMNKKGCKADPIAYGTILKAMVNAGQVEKAVPVFEEGKKTYKDLMMYSIMIDGFGRARKFDKAMSLLKEMRTIGIEPDVVVFNSLIASLCKVGEREEALDLYHSMASYGCRPNGVTKDILNTSLKKKMTKRRN